MKVPTIAAATITLVVASLSAQAAPPRPSVRMTPAQVKTFKGWVGLDRSVRTAYRQQKRHFKVGRKRLGAGAVLAPAFIVPVVIAGAALKAGQLQDPAAIKRALDVIRYGGAGTMAATGAGMMIFSKKLARPIDRYMTALNDARVGTVRSLAGQGRTVPASLEELLR